MWIKVSVQIYRKSCLLAEVWSMLASAVKPVANPLRSVPHPPPIGWLRGSGGREGETVLILIITSVEDTVRFHWGSSGTRCPKLCCYTTTKQQVLKIRFLLTQQIQTDIFQTFSSWRCSSSAACSYNGFMFRPHTQSATIVLDSFMLYCRFWNDEPLLLWIAITLNLPPAAIKGCCFCRASCSAWRGGK